MKNKSQIVKKARKKAYILIPTYICSTALCWFDKEDAEKVAKRDGYTVVEYIEAKRK